MSAELPEAPAVGAADVLSPEVASRYESLRSILASMGSVAVGFSGGVDSTLLLKAAADVLGDRALAVIGRSATYPSREYEEAVRLALAIGARYVEVTTTETDDLKFRENPVNRCYYCKTELFLKLGEVAAREGMRWIADGAITDDLSDFRPGRKAAAEQGARSPLLEAGLSKQDVREISRVLGLPTWEKGSFACLASRFPYGMQITVEALARIDEAETILRDAEFRNYRVRFHDARTARVEVGEAEIGRFFDAPFRKDFVTRLKKLGFTYVALDLQGYRTGSMNEPLRGG